MEINHLTKKIALLGRPLGHSISPIMHNRAFELLNLNYIYIPLEVEQDKLEIMLEALITMNFVGFNVTVPYKEKVLEHCSWLSEDARVIGAVNTVVIEEDRLKGYNSDWIGFGSSLKQEGFDVQDKRCVVIGAGGAARSVVYALFKANPQKIIIINRSVEKARELAKYFLDHSKGISINVFSLGDSNVPQICQNAHLIVNTTPLGMNPHLDKSPLTPVCFAYGQLVFDLVYNPPETLFLKYALETGAKTVNGMDMLIMQGAYGFKKWTGMDFPVKLIKRLVKKEGI